MLNILIAYPYMKPPIIKKLMEHKDKILFLLDSGAFTAWKSGNPIKLDDYCRFLEELPIKPWRYFTLDVIANPEATQKNYETMLARGFNPIPIFTPNEEYFRIDEFYKTSDLIGCGGLTDKYGNEGLRHLDKVFKSANGRKIHLLGYTNPKYIKYFKPFACDSSSWNRAQKYGLCDIYTGQGNYIQLTRQKAKSIPSKQLQDSIKSLGFDVYDLRKEESWRGGNSKANAISERTWVKYSLDLLKYIDCRLFLAIGGTSELDRLLIHHSFLSKEQ